jgi:hypothetical protein
MVSWTDPASPVMAFSNPGFRSTGLSGFQFSLRNISGAVVQLAVSADFSGRLTFHSPKLNWQLLLGDFRVFTVPENS